MNNMQITLKSIKEMHRLEKRLTPSTAVTAVVGAVLPVINIIFSSKIIEALETGAGTNRLIMLISAAILTNFALAFLNNFTSNMYYNYRWQMLYKEKESISKKLYSLDYETLESSDFKELLHKHAEAQDRVFSAFTQFSWMLMDFISGFLMLVIAGVILIPLFKIGFTKTGESFFESPAFLLVIFGCVGVMAVIILLLAIRMNLSLIPIFVPTIRYGFSYSCFFF